MLRITDEMVAEAMDRAARNGDHALVEDCEIFLGVGDHACTREDRLGQCAVERVEDAIITYLDEQTDMVRSVREDELPLEEGWTDAVAFRRVSNGQWIVVALFEQDMRAAVSDGADWEWTDMYSYEECEQVLRRYLAGQMVE